ncbi:MAG TPA: trypsin-like peptidase domain-containing protein [Blastocatellia bacterium]|nr:trypsin-like peptidase domain-containing protein [Blastocatellia bacterium]
MKAQSVRLALLILVVTCLAPRAFAADKPKKIKVPKSQVRQAAHQLVKIEVKMVQTKHLHRRENWLKWMFTEKVTKIGNGYYIEPNRVITNYHVVSANLPKDLRWMVGIDDEDPLSVVDIKVGFHKAKIVKFDPANDLAELLVEAKNPKSALPPPNVQPQKGLVAYSVNKDMNGEKELELGEVIGPFTLAVFKDGAYEPTDVNPTYRLPSNMTEASVLGLKLKAARGWSGCWVFDLDGKFLGIVRSAHYRSNLILLVPAQTVTDFLQNVTATSVAVSQESQRANKE